MVDFILNEEQQEYQKMAREVAQKHLAPNAHKFDLSGEFPEGPIQQVAESGLINLQVPSELGGLGLGCWDLAVVSEELAAGCAGIACTIETSAIAALPILLGGSDELKTAILKPMLEEGKFLGYPLHMFAGKAAIALTAKKEGNTYRLNGALPLVANGSVAKWLIVPAMLDGKMTIFVVDREEKGISEIEKPYKLGRRAADLSALKFEAVKCDFVVGTEGGGEEILTKAKPSTFVLLSAGAVGVARAGLENSVRYGKERKTFGKPIAEHQGLGFMLADMAKDIEASRLLTWQAAAAIDRGLDATTFAAHARSFSQAAAMRVATDAVQVYGGYGYSKEYPVEKLMRDAKMYQLFDGVEHEVNTAIGADLMAKVGG